MKITVKLRQKLQAGLGIKIDDAEGNTLISADAGDTTALEARVAALEASTVPGRVTTLEGRLAGYVDTSAELCPGGSVTVLTK